MSDPQHERLDAEAALAALRDARPTDAVSRRIVERALRPRPARRLVLPLGLLGGALAAAAAVVVFAWPSAPSGSAPIDGDRLAVGRHTVIRAPEADVEVVRRRADETLVRLATGAAHFAIEPLADGQSFRVRTPEVEIEVVGTAFRVETADGCSTVDVTEGRVRVMAGRDSSLLGAGESMRHCAAEVEAAVPGEALVREAQRLMLDPAAAAEAARLFERYLAEHPQGVFVEEAMFHLPFAQRAAGDEQAARRSADRFTEAFPDSRRSSRVRDAFPDPR